MALSNLQRTVLEKARASGAGTMGVSLGNDECNFLIATIASDLDLVDHFPELQGRGVEFFSVAPSNAGIAVEASLHDLFERLVSIVPDADTYFSCLAALHRSRLKYAKIIEHQPIPTMDQVGPRSLLQFGTMKPRALATFLLKTTEFSPT